MDYKNRRSTSSYSTLKVSNKQPGGFTSYFRKKNKKRQSFSKKDLEKRREAEEKLKEVLAPVQFSEEEEERLRELKQYKRWKRIQQQQQERYREIRSKQMPAIPETRAAAHSQDANLIGRDLRLGTVRVEGKRTIMAALHQHTWEQRIAVVSTLMVLLFVSIHADYLGRKVLPEQLFWDNSLVPWYIIVLKDCGIFCHMSACSLIHFALCDISLIYAFESMELGTKTGPKVKEFYREKVHVVVAAVSGGIVALSICKALILAWFRMLRDLLETAMAMISLGKDACLAFFQSLGVVSNAILNGLFRAVRCTVEAMLTTPPSEWIKSAFTGLARLITGICIWILAVVIPFDAQDRPLWARVMGSLEDDNATNQEKAGQEGNAPENHTLGDTWTSALNQTLNETLEAAKSPAPAVPKPLTWREDAFETCQWLLSHSAFFLVTLLVSLHLLTSSYRHKPTGADNETANAAASDTDDQSSIQTSPSLAHETALVANYSTDTSMETQSTVNHNRPTSITVTICSDSVTSRSQSRRFF